MSLIPTPRTARSKGSRVLRVGALAIAATTLASCYTPPDPKEWGAEAEKNFVEACSRIVQAADGTTTTIALASSETCECIYDAMVNTYNLKWDDMKDYESKLASTKDDDDRPTPPAALTKAEAECESTGPRVGSGSDSDEESDDVVTDAETTTTEAE